MNEHEWIAEQFDSHRTHLRAVAHRMLGSISEADDAVQESWVRVNRSGTSGVQNLGGWLTTVVARVCLDMLRARKSRREKPWEADRSKPILGGLVLGSLGRMDPETEAVLADSVGLALLVVLDTLAPAERIAFVLHDLFDLSFDEISPIVGRTPVAARQLASRARRRVRGVDAVRDADLDRQRKVVDAFLCASRAGDFAALLAVLDPGVVLRGDRAATPAGAPPEIRGAAAIAARAVKGGARAARPALVDGSIGVVVAPLGKLLMVLRFRIAGGKIVEMEAIGDPARIRQLELAVL